MLVHTLGLAKGVQSVPGTYNTLRHSTCTHCTPLRIAGLPRVRSLKWFLRTLEAMHLCLIRTQPGATLYLEEKSTWCVEKA